jgi:hypothetical protein
MVVEEIWQLHGCSKLTMFLLHIGDPTFMLAFGGCSYGELEVLRCIEQRKNGQQNWRWPSGMQLTEVGRKP